MAKIKLTKVPYFKERLIDIQGRTVSNINLEGSFALNLKSNEPFISYDRTQDAWFLDIPDTDLTTVNSSITTINTNITNIQNTLNSVWTNVSIGSLELKAYDASDNWLQDLSATAPGSDLNLYYFKGETPYFKYKVIGSTVIIQYLFAINLPDITDEPSSYFSIKLNLSAINSTIFNHPNVWGDNYFSTVVLPSAQRPADHLQMCYFKGGKLIFTCNNFINGHHGEPVGFNYDFGVANAYFYGPFKIVFSGTHVFEVGASLGGGLGGGLDLGELGVGEVGVGGGRSLFDFGG